MIPMSSRQPTERHSEPQQRIQAMNIEARYKDQAQVINYHRSSGWTIIRSKIATVTFATRPSVRNPEHIWVKAWKGSAKVPAWNYTFSTKARAEAAAKDLVESVRRSETRRAEQVAERKAKRAALKASDHWSVGDVVYTSWGYDQTNVEYYQVTSIKAKSVMVRQISVNSSDRGQPGGGKVAPRRYEFVGPEIFCPIDENGRFTAGPCWGKDKPSYRHSCYKWSGKAVYTSSDR
jgi:hypothetical protein